MDLIQILESVRNKSCQSYFKILHELFWERASLYHVENERSNYTAWL